MWGSIILIMYGLVSVMGSVAFLCKGSGKSASGYIYLFLLCHVLLIAIAMDNLFTPLHFIWIIIAMAACLVSRWLNGKFVFGKNHWLHYLVVTLIFAMASLMM